MSRNADAAAKPVPHRGVLAKHRWLLSLLLVLLIWEGGTRVFSTPSYLLPSPGVTMRALVADADFLGGHVAVTLVETLFGLALAIAAGLTVAVLMNVSALARDLVYPPLVLSQAIPLIAIAPLILIWFGLGVFAKVLIVAFVCFFPIVVNAYEGFRSVDPALRDLLSTLGASRADRYRHLYIPGALPGIFAGLKIAATYSVLGAVIGEWLGGSRGIGVYMTRSLQSFRTDRLFGAILIVMLMSFALFKVVDGASRLLVPWRRREAQ